MSSTARNMETRASDGRGVPRRAALGAALGLSFWAGGHWTRASGQPPQHAAQGTDPPGGHNMLVFGEKAVFLSHFPMFQQMARDGTHFGTIHRFQLILEAEFRTPQGQDATDLYRRARQQ